MAWGWQSRGWGRVGGCGDGNGTWCSGLRVSRIPPATLKNPPPPHYPSTHDNLMSSKANSVLDWRTSRTTASPSTGLMAHVEKVTVPP